MRLPHVERFVEPPSIVSLPAAIVAYKPSNARVFQDCYLLNFLPRFNVPETQQTRLARRTGVSELVETYTARPPTYLVADRVAN